MRGFANEKISLQSRYYDFNTRETKALKKKGPVAECKFPYVSEAVLGFLIGISSNINELMLIDYWMLG